MILAKSHACILVAALALIGAGIGASNAPDNVESAQLSTQRVARIALSPVSTTLSVPTESVDMFVARRLKPGPLGIRIQLPTIAVGKGCMSAAWDSPGHETCVLSDALQATLLVAVSLPSGQDIFVPVSWHNDAVTQVEQTPLLDRNEQLRSIFEKTFGAVLLETDFLGQDKVDGAFGIIGRVARISVAGVSLSGVYCSVAFGLAGNRVTQLLYCSSDKQKALVGTQAAMRSLRELNPSVEYKRGSFIEREHGAFVAKVEASSAADKQTISEGEKLYESQASIACAGASTLSVDYYQCREAKAEIRLGELKVAHVDIAASAVESEPEVKPLEEANPAPSQGEPHQRPIPT